MAFPTVINFEGLGACYWERVAKRPPRAGEFYLSGAVVAAWLAPNDLLSDYIVVKPTHYAILRHVYARGKEIVSVTRIVEDKE